MRHTTIDTKLLIDMLRNASKALQAKRDYINDLNVFPVPDGDTGFNMTKTFQGGVDTLDENDSIGTLLKKFSKGTLLSARGNSGVILSQFCRGFARDTAELEVITIKDFVRSMRNGMVLAYSSVVTPTEGTMLTLMNDGSEIISTKATEFEDFEDLFSVLIPALEASLQRTPELLFILKDAGVVDSGGAGFLELFRGMASAINGELIGDDISYTIDKPETAVSVLDENAKITYGYCTEFILQLFKSKISVSDFNIDSMIEDLSSLGDSIVAIQDEVLVKVHIHTKEPENVLSYAHRYGEFLSLKIENMTVQHNEIIADDNSALANTVKNTVPKPIEHKKYAFVAVASGSGIKNYFTKLGIDVIIDGGQTNNPSTEDFLQAFEQVSADYIVVLPNNSNIILTAEQAASMKKDSDVRVIKTKSIAEGFSCASLMITDAPTIDILIDSMTNSLDSVVTGLVTTATRDTSMNGIDIKQGDFIGLSDKTIYCACDDKVDAAYKLLNSLPDFKYKEVITIFAGNGVSKQEASDLYERLTNDNPMLDVGIIEGKQDIYYFIMAIE